MGWIEDPEKKLIPDLDPEDKKASDPGSGSATLSRNTNLHEFLSQGGGGGGI
jgi:hypothetical protein